MSSATGGWTNRRRIQGLTVFAALVVIGAAVNVLFPGSDAASIVGIVGPDYLSASLRLTVPIAFAALSGIFAEKSGVINIGIEGLLIISAFTGVAVTDALAGGGTASQGVVWVGFFAAVLSSVLLSLLFAVACIEFEADQIIAGLAVWLIALGFAPFASRVLWGSVNSTSVSTLNGWAIPVLSGIPVLGTIFFDGSPTTYMLLVSVPLAWVVLNRTPFGQWIHASGENPKALDTVGVDVHRVRYVSLLVSGVFAGIGGASLSLVQVGEFIGNGQTMVSGRGFIGITAYLFGNYNPIGAFGASFLFAGLERLQISLQQLGYNVPPQLVGMIPYVTVVVVLAFVGRTRIPEAAGEHYGSDED